MERLMTLSEAADFLSLAQITIRKKVSEREIPFYKIGGLIRFRREDLERWVQERKVPVAVR